MVWGRIDMYVSQKDYLQLMTKFYDEDDFLINTMISSDIKEMGGRIIPCKMEMIPAETPKQRTVIIYKSIQFDVPLKEDFFSIQNMKKIR